MTRLFHVSDVHFGAEDARAVDWFTAMVAADRPDAVIVTGDLTMRARRREFAAAADWLRGLAAPVMVQPGNHDLPYLNLVERFTAPYRRHETIAGVVAREVEFTDVAVVPLSTTARAQWRLNWSKGYVSDASLAQTLALIAAVPAGRRILVACHHPLIEAATRSTASTRGGAAALAALGAAGADAVLTGHVHDAFDLTRDIGGRSVRLIGAGTLSERVRVTPPSFNDIRIVDGAIAVTSRELTAL